MDSRPTSSPPGAGERAAPHADQGRKRELQALRERLSVLRDSLVTVREGTHRLAEIELRRRLTARETEQARTLRWESERLRHELRLLRERFEGLSQGAADAGAPR